MFQLIFLITPHYTTVNRLKTHKTGNKLTIKLSSVLPGKSVFKDEGDKVCLPIH